MGRGSVSITAKRGEEYPSLNLAALGLLHYPVSLRQSRLRPSLAKPRDGATIHRMVAYLRRAHGYARIGGVSLHLSSLRPVAPQSCFARVPAQTIHGLGVRRSYSAAHPAPLESPGFVFPDEPVRRDKGPLDLYPFPAHPCSARRLRRAGYSSPLFAVIETDPLPFVDLIFPDTKNPWDRF